MSPTVSGKALCEVSGSSKHNRAPTRPEKPREAYKISGDKLCCEVRGKSEVSYVIDGLYNEL